MKFFIEYTKQGATYTDIWPAEGETTDQAKASLRSSIQAMMDKGVGTPSNWDSFEVKERFQ